MVPDRGPADEYGKWMVNPTRSKILKEKGDAPGGEREEDLAQIPRLMLV